MNKIEEIFKAWRIAFNPNDAQADLASKRIEICESCEFKQDIPIGPGLHITRCSVCGCALKGKIYTPVTHLDPGGSCPKNKWDSVEDEWLASKQQ
jgi:ribosomal protein L37AE/L43A